MQVIERKGVWRGHRLLVTDVAGRHVGTYDVRSGKEDVFDARDLPRFKAAVANHLSPVPAQPTRLSQELTGPPSSSVPTPQAARVDATGPGMGSLLNRVPAHAVMDQLFVVQDAARPRSWLLRVWGVSPLSDSSRPWYLGAIGEMRIAAELAKLGRGWYVLHAVPVGAGATDIDHVVIGPAGVFTINTKHHAGQRIWIAGRKFMVAGKFYPHIPRAEAEAAGASERLSRHLGTSIPVTAAVAIVAAKEIEVKELPRTVLLASDRSLVRKLRKRKSVWAPAQVDRVAVVAAAPQVWHDEPVPSSDGQRLQRRFRALQREVRAAQRTRLAWVAGAGLTGLGALPHLVSAAVPIH
jgi:hypothetical protein